MTLVTCGIVHVAQSTLRISQLELPFADDLALCARRAEGWSAEEIEDLRQALIEDGLYKLLDCKYSARTKAEVGRWVFSDADHPFSFRVCAASARCDPDDLRRLVRFMQARKAQEVDDERSLVAAL